MFTHLFVIDLQSLEQLLSMAEFVTFGEAVKLLIHRRDARSHKSPECSSKKSSFITRSIKPQGGKFEFQIDGHAINTIAPSHELYKQKLNPREINA